MLAGLAVAAACSLGAATLPVGAAAAAQAAPVVEVTPAAPESSWSLIPPALRVAPHAVPEPGDRPADAALALIGSAALDPARVTTRSAVLPAVRASGDAAGGDLATGAGQALPVGIGVPLAASRNVVVTISRDRVGAGVGPAALGSRAPPVR